MTAQKAQMKRQDDGVIRLVCSGEEDSGEVEMTYVYMYIRLSVMHLTKYYICEHVKL